MKGTSHNIGPINHRTKCPPYWLFRAVFYFLHHLWKLNWGDVFFFFFFNQHHIDWNGIVMRVIYGLLNVSTTLATGLFFPLWNIPTGRGYCPFGKKERWNKVVNDEKGSKSWPISRMGWDGTVLDERMQMLFFSLKAKSRCSNVLPYVPLWW